METVKEDSMKIRTKTGAALLSALALAGLLALSATSGAIASPLKFYGQVEANLGQNSTSPTAVRVCGEEAFNVQAAAGGFSAVERTLIIERNINNALITTRDRSPNAVEVAYINNIPVIRVGGKHVVTIDHKSAELAGKSMAALAEEWANNMRRALSDSAKVDAYLAALGGDYISPNLATPYRRARLEAARINHAGNLFRGDVGADVVSSNSNENAGFAALMKRNPAEAEKAFRQAVAMDNGNERAHYGLGVSLLKQGKVDEAIKSFEYARWLDPDDAENHIAFGEALETKGHDTEALIRYKEASLLQPDNPEPVLYMADLREERNDVGKSVTELTEALKRMPDSQYIRLRRNDQLTWRLRRPY
jgi:tetratricopeptide (TPR) repeat protein